jgi:inosine/xanthosine triphosphate pyrophosphatase family protein
MTKKQIWKLNTSNQGKFLEFQKFFAKYSIELISTHEDLKEIEADPITVVTHKASQLEEETLIEDTILEVEGYLMGVNVKWLLNHLNELVGRKAVWSVYLAYRKGDTVNIYNGNVVGQIVKPIGVGGFGFDPFFQPIGTTETLAQSKPDYCNARALAVEALINDDKFSCEQAIYNWDGPWQNSH